MNKPAAIERRPLLAADLTGWTSTRVDVRSIPLHFVATYLLSGEQPLIEMLE
ncbi:MAG TPA: hypothetical protein VGA90_08240 [Methylomirabilota bacterium]|jgi:hypothetical protein